MRKRPILIEHTDGVHNATLFEFKLEIDNLNRVLMQGIKYLSKMRIKGYSVPSDIMLVSLNDAIAYHYRSEDYFEEIHKVYFGAASRNSDDFIAGDYKGKYSLAIEKDVIAIKHILQDKRFLPVRIDEDCIVGWGERYYRENPSASKGDFIGDNTGKVKIIGGIREPKRFKGLILPYKGSTDERFRYLMDKLNDRLREKDLGAFYTPMPYCEKAAELVRMAINRVPYGNDYVIIDRCACTGNLQSVLTDEELSHCILSTLEYYEYKVLCERLGDKVRFIVPPTESLVEYSQGLIKNADALSEQYVINESIAEYINNDKCTIILFENPPYQDSSSITFTDENDTRAKTSRNESFCETRVQKRDRPNKRTAGCRKGNIKLVYMECFQILFETTHRFLYMLFPCQVFQEHSSG